MFYDDDAYLEHLDGKTVAIIGYGSQGHAHALNLKDSGVDVVVGLRPDSSSVAKAEAEGLTVLNPIAEAASRGDVVMMLVPDELHRRVWEDEVRDGIAAGDALMFGHGFSIHFGEVSPAGGDRCGHGRAQGARPPRAPPVQGGHRCPGPHRRPSGRHRPGPRPGAGLREGHRRHPGGVIETTFKDETETDLFGEQAVLCGGLTELVRAGYETLVDAGYDPKLAYFECLHELKLIVDLMYEKGISGMRYSISNTAEYGDLTRGPRIVGEPTRAAMKEILGEIQDGTFAREWIAENNAGQENFKRMREEQAGHQVEREGKELRSMMDWIDTEF